MWFIKFLFGRKIACYYKYSTIFVFNIIDSFFSLRRNTCGRLFEINAFERTQRKHTLGRIIWFFCKNICMAIHLYLLRVTAYLMREKIRIKYFKSQMISRDCQKIALHQNCTLQRNVVYNQHKNENSEIYSRKWKTLSYLK